MMIHNLTVGNGIINSATLTSLQIAAVVHASGKYDKFDLKRHYYKSAMRKTDICTILFKPACVPAQSNKRLRHALHASCTFAVLNIRTAKIQARLQSGLDHRCSHMGKCQFSRRTFN